MERLVPVFKDNLGIQDCMNYRWKNLMSNAINIWEVITERRRMHQGDERGRGQGNGITAHV